MRYNFWFILSFFFLIVSCESGEKKQMTSDKIDSIQNSEEKIQRKIDITLSKASREAVKDWHEFEEVDDFILNYYNISVSDALTLSSELNDLVVLMRDSVRVDQLKIDPIKARLNVLQNETMRLKDMSTINSITAEEVSQEVFSILEVYDSFLSRINTIYKVEELQKALEFDTEKPVEVLDDSREKVNLPPRRTSVSSIKN